VGAAAGQDGDAASRAQLRDLGYDAAQAGGETGGEANTDIPREVLRSENPTARETIAIADAKLAAELWTSVESLIRAGRLALEEFSLPVAQHLMARARLLK
jgi:hypothetical protein